MSTNKRAVPGRDDLAEVKLRSRRKNLLYTHTRVAALATEFRSHGLDSTAIPVAAPGRAGHCADIAEGYLACWYVNHAAWRRFDTLNTA